MFNPKKKMSLMARRVIAPFLALLALFAVPCSAAEQLIPPPPMTPKQQVQVAVNGGEASASKNQPFSRQPASGGVTTIMLSPDTVALTPKELRALGLTNNWSKSGPPPFLVKGRLTYIHGGGGIPTIIASPLQITDVELEPYEQVNEIVTGDSARWLVEVGTAGNTTHIFIKPLDVGLESSVVVTTDRRVYHLRLVSKSRNHMPYVGFVYSSDLRQQLADRNASEARKMQWSSTTDASGATTNLAALNFNYEIKGNAPWKPERVFDDGRKTYLQLPATVASGEMPVLLVKKGKKDVLVNYRLKGQTMEVDGMFQTIALVTGVSGGLFKTGMFGEKQQIVEITRKPKQ